jgi:hypothetical protein
LLAGAGAGFRASGRHSDCAGQYVFTRHQCALVRPLVARQCRELELEIPPTIMIHVNDTIE